MGLFAFSSQLCMMVHGERVILTEEFNKRDWRKKKTKGLMGFTCQFQWRWGWGTRCSNYWGKNFEKSPKTLYDWFYIRVLQDKVFYVMPCSICSRSGGYILKRMKLILIRFILKVNLSVLIKSRANTNKYYYTRTCQISKYRSILWMIECDHVAKLMLGAST